MSSYAEWVAMASDIVVGIAAGVGAYVAWRGLGTWRQQLRGSSEYELSRRILRCTYQLRDAISLVRHPAMLGSEMPEPPPEQAANMDREQRRYYGTSGAYSARFGRVLEHSRALQTELQEAEALWGARLKPLFDELFALQHGLWMAIHAYLRSIDPSASQQSRESFGRLFYEKHDAVLYDTGVGTNDGDEFSKRMLKAVAQIEDELREHLHRS